MALIFDVIVIGAGAAGIMAAITAADNNKRVAVIEHTDRIAKKILQTGNGRCNLTNLNINEDCYCMENADFAMKVIKDFDEKAVIDFFNGCGLLTHDRSGYVYPNTDQASSVNDILCNEIKRRKIDVFTETTTYDIYKKNDRFVICTDRGEFKCKSLVIAAGSKAYSKTGSDGSGYLLASLLGHNIIKPLPALTSLRTYDNIFKTVAGVRCDGKVSLYIDGEYVLSDRGEIQFTDYGISGIPVFQVSRYAVKASDEKKDVFCRIDLLYDYCEEQIMELIKNKYKTATDVYHVFNGLINSRITEYILKKSDIYTKEISSVDDKDIERFVKNIKNFRVDIKGYNSFDYGQVCQGGVDTKEIYPATMESKLIKGLFFAGEIVDVDGICGGYNLQWAWSSGHKAGENA